MEFQLRHKIVDFNQKIDTLGLMISTKALNLAVHVSRVMRWFDGGCVLS